MNKATLLKIIRNIDKKLKTLYYNKTEVNNLIGNMSTRVKSKLSTDVTNMSSNLVNVVSAHNSLISVVDDVEDEFGSVRTTIGKKETAIMNETNSTIANKTANLATGGEVYNLHKDSYNTLKTRIDNLYATLLSNGVDTSKIDTAVKTVQDELDTYQLAHLGKLNKLGLFMGKASTYATLPTKDGTGNIAGLNDVALLTSYDLLGYEPGLYKHNGSEYHILNSNPPINRPQLEMLIDLHGENPDNIFIQNAIKNANVSLISDMSRLFYYNATFNLDISKWDVSNVTTMRQMFSNAIAFNQPLANWVTTNVTNMSQMFYGAAAFNQPIRDWNVSNVTNMYAMFYNATFFNQYIANWKVDNVSIWNSFKINSSLTDANTPAKFR